MSRLRHIVREIHRRSLWQVLGIYGVTSWIIWQVVVSLYDGIGLPEWVPPTALVLLLVGLPIVLATAFIQEGGPELRPNTPVAPVPGLETTDGSGTRDVAATAAAPDPPTRPRLFTWNRAITGGVLAFALLGLAATGFMGMRSLGIGPAATLVSRGVLDVREPILLADFESASGDSVLAAAITEALRVDLEQATVVTLLQPAFAQDALRRMRLDPHAKLTPALAMDLAVREGVKAVVVGDITAAGPSYILTARVIGSDGAVLASVRETAPADALIPAADRLSRALRERLGESIRSIRRTEPLAQVTTPSLDALRRYSQALRAHDSEPEPHRAIALLREAIEHDSAFAMAWRKLGIAYQNLDQDSLRHAVTMAFEHRNRLTDRERYLTEGTYYDIVANDTARAMAAYETLLELHPTEPAGLNNLGRLHGMQGDASRAAELYRRSIEAHPYAASPIRNLVITLIRLSRFDEASKVLDGYEESFPGHFYGPRLRMQIAAGRFDYEEVVRQADRLAGFTGREVEADQARAAAAIVRGRHEAGLARLARVARDAAAHMAEQQLIEARVFLLLAHHLDAEAARAELVAEFPDRRLAAMGAADRPYHPLAMIHAVSGHAGAARRYVDAWRTARPADFAEPVWGVREVLAELSLADGDPGPIIEMRRRSIADGCFPCWAHLGRAYETAGMPDSAVVAYRRYLAPEDNPAWRIQADQIWLPFVYQRIATVYEELGDTASAAEFHARLLDLWREADPVLEPRLEHARRALARLSPDATGG